MVRVLLIYAQQDSAVARRIAEALTGAGFQASSWDSSLGDASAVPLQFRYHELRKSIATYDLVVVLWSRASVKSPWVNEALEFARARQKTILGVFVEPSADLRQTLEPLVLPWDRADVHFLEFSGADGLGELVNSVARLTSRSPSEPQPNAVEEKQAVHFDPAPSINERETANLALPSESVAIDESKMRGDGSVGVGLVGPRGLASRTLLVLGLIKVAWRILFHGSASVIGAATDVALEQDPVPLLPSPLGLPEGEQRPDPVLLGVTAPRTVAVGAEFTAVLVAYVERARASAQQKLEQLGDTGDRQLLDVSPSGGAHWAVGAPVSVTLTGEHLDIAPAECRFAWNGRENLASFAVRVRDGAPATNVNLCFHVALAGVPIAFIPLRLCLSTTASTAPTERAEFLAPNSAFASYSSKDAELVSHSLSALARWSPGVDIFQDCLDLAPNETFKPQLAEQIAARDVFLLFWSRNAAASPWVQWEYQTARDRKGLNAILPMPLEDPAIAEPPADFAAHHLRDRFLLAGYGLQKIQELAARQAR